MKNTTCFKFYGMIFFLFGLIQFCFPTVGFAKDLRLNSNPPYALAISEVDAPIQLKGIKINDSEPFKFDFLVDNAGHDIQNPKWRNESLSLIKYFLASLTVPEKDMWVNLSPHEKNRIMPESFGVTEMGRDLLWQDYVLKQLTASVLSPEHELGQNFWRQIYQKMETHDDLKDLSVETFHKIWIIPDQARVYVNESSAYVMSSHLKVMMEEDYLSQVMHENASPVEVGAALEAMKKIILPEIEKKVNEGREFSNLRQIYNAVILATWYKKHIKESILAGTFVDQNKVVGVDVNDENVKHKIYNKYVEDLRKGVYSHIHEDYDPVTQDIITRQYFTGGLSFVENSFGAKLQGAYEEVDASGDNALLSEIDTSNLDVLSVYLNPNYNAFQQVDGDQAMLVKVTDMTQPLGSLDHDESFVRRYPLKLSLLDVLKASGIPVREGLVIDTRDFVDLPQADLNAKILAYVTEAFTYSKDETYLLRSLDDDVGAMAGKLESYVISDLQKEFLTYWEQLNSDYANKQDELERSEIPYYLPYMSSPELMKLIKGEKIVMDQISHMALLQPVHDTKHSGVITSTQDRIIVNFVDGLHGAGTTQRAKKLVMSYDGDVLFYNGEGNITDFNKSSVAETVRNIRTVLYQKFNISGRTWIIEFGANLFDESNLDLSIFQVRSGIMPSAEEEVDPIKTPEIFRYGGQNLPLRGNLIHVQTQADIEVVKYSDIVLVNIADIDKNNLNFTKMNSMPQAIFTDGGSRSVHAVLNIRFLNTFSARPDFFTDLMDSLGETAELTLDRFAGRLNYTIYDDVQKEASYSKNVEDHNKLVQKSEEDRFQIYMDPIEEQAFNEGYDLHPDRSIAEVVEYEGEKYFLAEINSVKLFMMFRDEYLSLSNSNLVALLERGPLRYAFSVYDGIVMAFPYHVINERGTSHSGMNNRFNGVNASSNIRLSQLDSIRAWNFKGGIDISEKVVDGSERVLELENNFGGNEGAPLIKSPEKLMKYFRTLVNLGVTVDRLLLRFDLTKKQRYELANAMLTDGGFSKDLIYAVLQSRIIEWDDHKYIVPNKVYQDAKSYKYRQSDDIWKRVLYLKANSAVTSEVSQIINIKEGLSVLDNSNSFLNEDIINLLLTLQNTTDKALLVNDKSQPNSVIEKNTENVGGINLNSQLLTLYETFSDVTLTPKTNNFINTTESVLDANVVKGFSPVIFQISPVLNLPVFLELF